MPVFKNLLTALDLDLEKALFSCSYVHTTYEAEPSLIENLMSVPPSPPCPDLDQSFDAALGMLQEIQKKLKDSGVTDGIAAVPVEDLVKREKYEEEEDDEEDEEAEFDIF